MSVPVFIKDVHQKFQPLIKQWKLERRIEANNRFDTHKTRDTKDFQDRNGKFSLNTRKKIVRTMEEEFGLLLCWVPSHCGIEGNEVVDKLENIDRNANDQICNKINVNDLSMRIGKMFLTFGILNGRSG